MSYHMFNTQVAKKLGIVEAVLLHNIQFWIDKNRVNEKHFYKGRYWTYNSAKAFSELFEYLSDRQISRALKQLVDDGWLIKDNFNANPFDRTNWYALTDKYYNEFMGQNGVTNSCEAIHKTKDADLPKMVNGKTKSGNSYIDTDIKPDIKRADINTNINTDSRAQTQKELADSLFNFFGFESENSVSASKAKEKQDDLVNLENEFNQIWDIYPKKQDKQAALNSYLKARKGSKIALNSRGNTKVAPQSFETISRGVRNYLRANRGVEIKFIKHLSTFLNQQAYLDFQSEVNNNKRVGVVDNHEDYINADKSIYIPKPK